MKTLILSLFIFCLAAINTTAQDKNGPQIEFNNTEHDYGTIENGADGSCEFKFKNTGKEPLLISNCQASCGCTVPSWPREAILPGQTGVIQVVYDTKRTGGIHKTITITSNATNEPTKTVTIKGTVNAPTADAIAPDAVPQPVPTPTHDTDVDTTPGTVPQPAKSPKAKATR